MDFEEGRNRMVGGLVADNILTSPRVIAAFRKLERHLFIPPVMRDAAYYDAPVPIGRGQTISAPHMVAIMTELLGVDDDSSILEVGAGSGYQAAILAELANSGRIISVERVPELAGKAGKLLFEMGYRNVKVVVGDGTLGVPEYAPYDRIIVTAAAPKIPEALVEQIKPGGKMVIPVGGRWSQRLVEVDKGADGRRTDSDRGGVVFVPLVGQDGWKD
ncbi:MAG: protein-L-isoaspartate(D-aspartate) O-methyltransferase [Candidatus Altiarchaeota archaeon]